MSSLVDAPPPVSYDVSSNLLHILSARRELSWRNFKVIFESLYAPLRAGESKGNGEWGSSFALRRTSATLDALGHACFSFEEGRDRVYVAPTILALLPRAGLPEAVLCGARSPDTREQVAAVCNNLGAKLTWQEQTQRAGNAFVPARVSVTASSLETLKQVAQDLAIRFSTSPPAWDLCQISPSLSEILSDAQIKASTTLDWRLKTYDVAALRWQDTSNASGQGEFPADRGGLLCYSHPRRQLRRHYWAGGEDGSRPLLPIDPDWGRYAALKARQKHVLVYDERSLFLAVPAGAPLPRVLGRAIALCSGFSPALLPRRVVSWDHPEMREFAVYESVPPQIAQAVAEKLAQRLVRKEIRL
jgi:hypothetical protein